MPRTKPPNKPGNRRAAVYARVSDKSQAEDDKTSLADMEAYCAERGYAITARYEEVGRGWSKNRPRVPAHARRRRLRPLRRSKCRERPRRIDSGRS